jgi:excisionase family DNA binding protein
MDDKLLYRVPEVAAALNVSRSKVYELLKDGALPSVHIDRTRLVRSTDLHDYIESLVGAE